MTDDYTRVKICGITNDADRAVAVQAGADALGFIAAVPVETPREISVQRACDLVAAVPPFVTAVLVTMPSDVEQAVSLFERVQPDALQIHGTLSPQQLSTLQEQVACAVIAVLDHKAQASDKPSVETDSKDTGEGSIDDYAAVADALVIDSTDEEGGGGTGETHDWEQTRAYASRYDTPVVLAGGLTPHNVEDAVNTVDPFGVDTASGVEVVEGEKSQEAIAAFVRRARSQEVST